MVTSPIFLPIQSLVDAYSKVDHSFCFLFKFEKGRMPYYTAIYMCQHEKKKHIELFTQVQHDVQSRSVELEFVTVEVNNESANKHISN